MTTGKKRILQVSLAATLTALIAGGGLWLVRQSSPIVATGYRDLSPQASISAEASPSPSPSLSPSPSPSASPSKSPSPKPKPSRKPTNVPKPPPPPTKPSGCVPHYEGTNVPREQVGTALSAAAAKRFWKASEGDISLPPNLIKAVAEQESGWQSAIVSCIGAVGAMQVLPATATWMNGRFGTSYNVREVQGNAMLGSEYLQWLMKYFGDAYFEGDYSLSCSNDPAVADYREYCLLNAIISAYNVGHGTVEQTLDKAIANNSTTFYVNHAYIENVRALMSRF